MKIGGYGIEKGGKYYRKITFDCCVSLVTVGEGTIDGTTTVTGLSTTTLELNRENQIQEL